MYRVKQRVGKYRIEGKIGEGGFAVVYRAMDTIEGIRVALKVPHPHLVASDVLDGFREEARLAARLEHANILPLKYADYIGGHFTFVYRLGERTLEDRLRQRMSPHTALNYWEQTVSAVAYAHEHRVIHCDIKPDNLILFGPHRVRLTDFGIAKIAWRTIDGSGSGTLGYVAPEQAMGKPSTRSDVFSLGMLLYRMLAGVLPEWPYEWPPLGYRRLRSRAPAKLIDMIRRAIGVDPRKRYRDATQLLNAYRRIKPQVRNSVGGSRRVANGRPTRRDWQLVRRQQFQREFGTSLETRHSCTRCQGPVSEAMRSCPWCGSARKVHREKSRFPLQCPRCQRGMKSDWHYCAWCYGSGFEPSTKRSLSDRRYKFRCTSPRCKRRDLMPFMRYCPWCHVKVQRKWKIEGSKNRCRQCGWGVVGAFWSYCPWCSKTLTKT